MFAAIITLVTAIVGGVFGVVKSDKAQGLFNQQTLQADKQFAQGKELSVYNIYQSKTQMVEIIVVAGFIGLIVFVYMLNNKK